MCKRLINSLHNNLLLKTSPYLDCTVIPLLNISVSYNWWFSILFIPIFQLCNFFPCKQFQSLIRYFIDLIEYIQI